MDLWIVAAAAGAWYLAKYLDRFSRTSDGSSQLSSEDSNFENLESLSCPFQEQAWRDELSKYGYADKRASDGKSSDVNSLDGLLATKVTSNGRLDSKDLKYSGNHCYSDVLTTDAREIVSNYHSGGNKTFLRTKYLYGDFSRPVSSLESCLMAHLYKENAKMEEHVLSSISLPSTSVRPFLVSDGSQIISRGNDDSSGASTESGNYKLHKKACEEKVKRVFGFPSLPNDPEKMTNKAGNGRNGRSSSCNNVFDATLLFSLGISFGIMTSIMANKREVDKLRELLKQNENLVQDLEEEIEMRDSMTVKELNNDNYGSQDTYDHFFFDKELNGFSPENHMDNSLRNDGKKLYDHKAEESPEDMSKIEAELEAELERLGLDMNMSSRDKRLSELVEIDPEFIADFSQGELGAGTIRLEASGHPKSSEDDSGTSTILPGNYAVSPRELSLRLHEVIQSRLEKRVEELEIALQNGQRKIQIMESERKSYSLRNLSSCRQASPITRGTPLSHHEDFDPMAQPLVMNLSGETLDAYNEAYEELIKMDESEEDSPSDIYDNDQKEALNQQHWHVRGLIQSQANCNITHSSVSGEQMPGEVFSGKLTMLEDQSSSVCKLNLVSGRDQNCDIDYELESQLVKQIVERAKKESHVFQNAQRMLHSADEDEH